MPRISLLLAKDPTGVALRYLKEKSRKTCPAFLAFRDFADRNFEDLSVSNCLGLTPSGVSS
jgi:hypothetical protein